MIRQATALSYAIRLRVVLKYLGYVCAILAILTLVPLGVSLFFGDTDISWRYATVIVGLGVVGAILSRLPTPSRVQANEGMVLVAATFLIAPLVMTYPILDVVSKFLMIPAIALGGGIGSTSGGFKILRFLTVSLTHLPIWSGDLFLRYTIPYDTDFCLKKCRGKSEN